MLKFVQLLKSSGSTVRRLSAFITKAFEVRNSVLNAMVRQ